jgi:hypothetical protein
MADIADTPPDPDAKTAADVAESGGLASLTHGVRDLAEDVQTLVEAELAYQSARAAYVWNSGQAVIVWLLVAGAAGFFALVALVVGLLLALVPLIGVWGALGSVALGLALIAWMALRVALKKFGRLRSRAISADPVVPAKGVAVPEPLGPPAPTERPQP